METIKINSKLTQDERETILVYNGEDKVWHMDTTIPKHANKAKKQSWTQLTEYVYKDGTECGGVFQAPAYAITIRSAEKKQMSDKQKNNLFGNDED